MEQQTAAMKRAEEIQAVINNCTQRFYSGGRSAASRSCGKLLWDELKENNALGGSENVVLEVLQRMTDDIHGFSDFRGEYADFEDFVSEALLQSDNLPTVVTAAVLGKEMYQTTEVDSWFQPKWARSLVERATSLLSNQNATSEELQTAGDILTILTDCGDEYEELYMETEELGKLISAILKSENGRKAKASLLKAQASLTGGENPDLIAQAAEAIPTKKLGPLFLKAYNGMCNQDDKALEHQEKTIAQQGSLVTRAIEILLDIANREANGNLICEASCLVDLLVTPWATEAAHVERKKGMTRSLLEQGLGSGLIKQLAFYVDEWDYNYGDAAYRLTHCLQVILILDDSGQTIETVKQSASALKFLRKIRMEEDGGNAFNGTRWYDARKLSHHILLMVDTEGGKLDQQKLLTEMIARETM